VIEDYARRVNSADRWSADIDCLVHMSSEASIVQSGGQHKVVGDDHVCAIRQHCCQHVVCQFRSLIVHQIHNCLEQRGAASSPYSRCDTA